MAISILKRNNIPTVIITKEKNQIIKKWSTKMYVDKLFDGVKNKEKITITDPAMTRFSISMDKALDFILHATEIAKGSEIFVENYLSICNRCYETRKEIFVDQKNR